MINSRSFVGQETSSMAAMATTGSRAGPRTGSMMGGRGADTFEFAADSGHDTADFQTGRDKIDLTALAADNIHDFGDLDIEVTGGSTIIHFDADNDVTIAGAQNLSANDFWFA